MKKLLFIATFILILGLALPASSFAQDNDHTAREEAEGKAVWEKLQAKELTCNDLADDNFGALGEYFMGQMAGDAHEAMNNMMIRMMGESGEEQTHVVMGKRMSGCDTAAAFPSGAGFMSMMNMMMGGLPAGQAEWSSPFGFNNQRNNSMMNFGLGGGIMMILFWAAVIIFIVWAVKEIGGRNSRSDSSRALDILKERYVKGEINKEEFEQKKKDIV